MTKVKIKARFEPAGGVADATTERDDSGRPTTHLLAAQLAGSSPSPMSGPRELLPARCRSVSSSARAWPVNDSFLPVQPTMSSFLHVAGKELLLRQGPPEPSSSAASKLIPHAAAGRLHLRHVGRHLSPHAAAAMCGRRRAPPSMCGHLQAPPPHVTKLGTVAAVWHLLLMEGEREARDERGRGGRCGRR